MVIYIVTKFGADWFIFLDARVKSAIFPNSRINKFDCSGPFEPKIELIRDLVVTHFDQVWC